MNAIPAPDGGEAATIEMWFDFASPYSYLSLARLPQLARAAGVRVALRPFLLGPVFQAQGWSDTPFRLYPKKGAYIVRDVERLAEKHGVPYRWPSAFPRVGLLPSRVALLVEHEPWAPAFCLDIFRTNFVDDRDIQAEDTVRGVLRALSQDDEALVAQARSDVAKQALRRRVDEALQRGIFGAPTFMVGDEMFWGNDRLEDALAWAVRPGTRQPGSNQ